MSHIFECESIFYCSVNDLFSFHESKLGFETLVSADPKVEVIQAPKSLNVGEEAILKVKILPFIKVDWIARHTEYKPNQIFVDEQIKGPFQKFKHSHIFEEYQTSAKLIDKIELEFPLFLVTKSFLEKELRALFLRRHFLTSQALNCGYENKKARFV